MVPTARRTIRSVGTPSSRSAAVARTAKTRYFFATVGAGTGALTATPGFQNRSWRHASHAWPYSRRSPMFPPRISQPDSASAWLEASRIVHALPKHEAHHVVIDVADPVTMTAAAAAVVDELDGYLAQ